ncbi:hypothetical protein [Streptomyces mirabilis]
MAYYKAVEKVMGGSAATEGFARLFLPPGVAHCGGGNTTAGRPVHPFPYVAKNTTGGPADDAGSYTPVRSTAEANLTLNRLGSFRSGYETVGNWVHGEWVVSKGKA